VLLFPVAPVDAVSDVLREAAAAVLGQPGAVAVRDGLVELAVQRDGGGFAVREVQWDGLFTEGLRGEDAWAGAADPVEVVDYAGGEWSVHLDRKVKGGLVAYPKVLMTGFRRIFHWIRSQRLKSFEIRGRYVYKGACVKVPGKRPRSLGSCALLMPFILLETDSPI
jgi:hypothetical protein